ncbi:type II toxin-antitoxin system VapB family antitoxin [Hoeflea ulvae]|uniref:Type II toxin-antitoxin system VapB family antitoxin n=1 Tax=Hoeflea ulvae TaxID=2983764 RepID=A0ABT3YK88_9HYPH|nr:type II toxin-antitoxin system VapB family antitoxin [Hoeflea ulvae]MCY0096194.1 type II toxin-antitoxin system VapB family antitoxin [Hoeflea ulvae]
MALFIKDESVDALAERYQAAIKAKTKTEAVRQALERALGEPGVKQNYVDRGVAWSKAFNARTKRSETEYDEKAFIDNLYEDD